MNSRHGDRPPSKPPRPMDCEAIQELLTDYLARELGSARSALVREHLIKCPRCQAAAQELRQTLRLLQEGDAARLAPTTLSEQRRRQLRKAAMHPVMAFVYQHQRAVALALALAALALLAAILSVIPFKTQPDRDTKPRRLPPVVLYGEATDILVDVPPRAREAPITEADDAPVPAE